MAEKKGQGWDRRDFMGAVALVALVVGVPTSGVILSNLDEKDAPTEPQRRMMREVAQAVLPRTDTPGAGEVGVGDFVIVALAHGLDGTRDPSASSEMPRSFPEYRRTDGSLRYVDWLEGQLDRRAGGDWLGKPPERRAAVLVAIDAEAFAEGENESPWKKIKGLILTGYYTSEIGGSRELQYEPVPGRFDPAVPLAPGARGFSNDWTGVEFG